MNENEKKKHNNDLYYTWIWIWIFFLDEWIVQRVRSKMAHSQWVFFFSSSIWTTESVYRSNNFSIIIIFLLEFNTKYGRNESKDIGKSIVINKKKMALICIANGIMGSTLLLLLLLFFFNRSMPWHETIFAIQRMRNKVVIQFETHFWKWKKL